MRQDDCEIKNEIFRLQRVCFDLQNEIAELKKENQRLTEALNNTRTPATQIED